MLRKKRYCLLNFYDSASHFFKPQHPIHDHMKLIREEGHPGAMAYDRLLQKIGEEEHVRPDQVRIEQRNRYLLKHSNVRMVPLDGGY